MMTTPVIYVIKSIAVRQNLHRHNKRFHPKITPKCSIQEQNYSKTLPSGAKIVKIMKQEIKNFFVIFVKNHFQKYNLIRHLKLNRCVKLKDIENENIILKKENEEFKKRIKCY